MKKRRKANEARAVTIKVPAEMDRALEKLKKLIKPFPPTTTAIVLRGLELAMREFERKYVVRRA